MRAVIITAITLISTIASFRAEAQFGLFSKNYRVKRNPSSAPYKLQGEEHNLVDGLPKDKEAWVVFSDQSNNITYKSPGGDVQLKSLSFMQPCYVIGMKGDYLRLAKYEPGLKINGRKLAKQSAENLGWIHKSRMLLWSNTLKDRRTKFNAKAITAYSGENAFSTLPGHVSGDSLVLFQSPFLKGATGTSSMENIFYIYKQSGSGNEYLVSASPKLFADSPTVAKTGWISRDLVKVWGTRALFMLNEKNLAKAPRPASPASVPPGVPFYGDTTFLRKDKRTLPMLVADEEHKEDRNLLENVYPINGFYRSNDGTGLIRTAVMTDALDRSMNEIYNVSGNKITYGEYKKILKDNSRLNIVFVADGGAENAKYMTELYTILQNLELHLATNNPFKKVKIGSVVYKDNLRDCRNAVLPLTSDFKSVSDFWTNSLKQSFNCNDGYTEQAVFSGLAAASEMLYKNKDESNIIVLFGGAGNNANSGSGWDDVISRLSYVNARLLIFQSHSPSDLAYSNFVVQAKQLVLESANNIADLKKEKLVDFSSKVLSTSSFYLETGDSGIYYLNYPNKAMTQGYILFPGKGEVMQPSLLSSSLDSLITQVNKDNKMVEESLFRYFRTIGSRNTKVESKYAFKYPGYTNKYLPEDFLRSNGFRTQSFYIPAWTSIQTSDSSKMLQSGLLLTTEEYLQLTSQLISLGFNKKSKSRDRGDIYDLITGEVEKAVKEKNMELGKPAGDLTFSEALEAITGYRSLDPAWLGTTLKIFKQSNRIDIQQGTRFLEESARKASWLRDNINNGNIQFTNNGRTYYLLSADKLPGNI